MAAVGHANSKLLLFGEHAAVYGYPAVGFSLPWGTKVTLSKSEVLRWTTPTNDLSLIKILEQLPFIFPESVPLPPFEIHVETATPIGVGFGSSAALSVALARGVFEYLGHSDPSQKTLWDKANEIEKIFHSTPSGIDTGLSLQSGLCYFEKRENEALKVYSLKTCQLHLVMGAVARNSDTKNLIAKIKEHKDFSLHMREVGTITAKAIEALICSAESLSKKLGVLATTAQERMSALGLSTAHLDEIFLLGKSLGASGGKLSGAGGGGAYFLIAETKNHAMKLAEKLRKAVKEKNIPHVVLPQYLEPV